MFVDRNTGRTDTIAKLRPRPQTIAVQMDSLGRARNVMPSATEPNAQAEFAQLFFDGWLAVVRLEPLRVDWRSPAGQWTRGAAFPLKPLPVDARERKAIEPRRAESREFHKQNGLLVINRTGAIDGEIVLAANEDYAGFGAQSIYISYTDDDLQRLRRRPWP